MDGGFPYGDLIVLGAIAAFILLRYRAMLGEPRGRDENDIQSSREKTDTRGTKEIFGEVDRVLQLPLIKQTAAPSQKDDFAASYGPLGDALLAMRGVDREFSPEEFLEGARMAYEMVIAAYSKRDRDTLKMLLSPEMFKSFELSLNDAEAAGRFADTTLVAINKATISAAKLSGSLATLTVDFVSEQIHLIRDVNGVILEGDASLQQSVEDQWVFTRTLTSNNLNWVIVET